MGGIEQGDSVREQERSELIAGLQGEQAQGRLLFAETDHFIVVYRDIPEIYREFAGWMDTHPAALAQHLEAALGEAKDLFRVTLQDTFQVVEVKKGGLFSLGGVHTGGKRRLLSLKEWEHARFSQVYSRKRRAGFTEPAIYGFAVHEAIGHGVIGRALFGDEVFRKAPNKISPELDFFLEGIATYTQYSLSGVDPHDYMRQAMLDAALLRFTDLTGRWRLGTLPEDEMIEHVRRFSRNDGFSISGVFKLQQRGEGRGESQDTTDKVDLKALFAKYSRGGSFVKFLIDRYGVEAFKQFSRQASSGDFFASLVQVTGRTVEAIEREWKEAVLTDAFLYNPMIEAAERGLSAGRRSELETQRRSILDVYREYS